MITKNLVVKIQNLVVNHESWPVKSKPDTSRYIVTCRDLKKKKKVLLYFGILLFLHYSRLDLDLKQKTALDKS